MNKFNIVHTYLTIFLGVLSTRKIYPYLIVFGWIFPLFIPIVTIIVANTVNNSTYVDTTSHCFLTYEGGLIWSFIAPVMVILTINVVFLVIAIAKIVNAKLKNDHRDILKDTLIAALVNKEEYSLLYFSKLLQTRKSLQ